jgi:hypothetical protein
MYLEADVELDWLEWAFFLEMLSVERTEPFLSELALPFEPEHFPKVIRLARACLEVHVAPTVRIAENDPEFFGLTRAWQRYRKTEGVLSDKALRKFLERYAKVDIAAQAVYSELQDLVGATVANALKRWFVNNFRSGPDPVWQWPWALRLFFLDNPRTVGPTTSSPLTEEERQILRSFFIRYGYKQRQLESRFQVISYAATAALPTLWESVLQAFGGGLGNRYPWLGNIEQCLELRLTRKEWTRLKVELGPNLMENLITWMRTHEKLLPYNTTLPNEPELV